MVVCGPPGRQKNYPETAAQGTFWRSTVIETDTRRRAARGLEKTETEARQAAFQHLKARGNAPTPPPLSRDGWGGIDQALMEVYGQVPPYQGRGRPPSKKQAGEDWQYLQVIKHRDTHGSRQEVELTGVLGDEAEVRATLGRSTAYVERTPLTMRHSNARLIRKGLGFSKNLILPKAAAAWEDLVYNVARPLKTLRQKIACMTNRRWQPRTPAMAAGLTDRVWTVCDILRAVPLPAM